MQTTASQRLLSLPLPANASVTERGDTVQLRIRRNEVDVVVTVPKTVREWFVEATDMATGSRAEDWCDYDGYDSTPLEQLDRDMAEDVALFVQKLLSSDLRFEVGGRARLFWKSSESWQQAVPFDASVASSGIPERQR